MKRAMVRLGVVLVLGLGLAAALLWATGSVGDSVFPVVVRAAERPRRAQAAGEVYCVTPEGGTYSGCTQVFTNVQAAVDAAGGGETIKVATGTYTDVHARPRRDTVTTGVVTQVVYVSKTVHIIGGYTTTNWDTSYPVAQPTTLDPGGKGRGVYVTGDVTFTVEGVTFTGGDATGLGGLTRAPTLEHDAGGGVYVYGATIALENNYVLTNVAEYGGGIYVHDGVVTLRDNQVRGNVALSAGGVSLSFSDAWIYTNTIFSNSSNGLVLSNGTATISGNTIASNGTSGLAVVYSTATIDANIISSNTSGFEGGGLFIAGSTVTITANAVFSNVTSEDGGGLVAHQSDMILDANTITSNTAEGAGGGITLVDTDNARISRNVIASNHASQSGGGLYALSGHVVLDGNTIVHNTADYEGGGLCAIGMPGVTFDTFTVTANIFAQNVAGSAGGGLYLWAFGSDSATLVGNTIISNCAETVGGGLHTGQIDVTLINNVVADNQANTDGGGMWIQEAWGTSAWLLHNTVARNTSGNGSGIYVDNMSDGTVVLTNTILVSHTVGIIVTAGSTATLEATLWGTDTWGNGMDWGGAGTVLTGTPAHNWWAAPGFVAPDAGDYHLRPDSAAIDKGVDAHVTTDVDGDGRPMGAGPDLGADEAPRALYVDRDAIGANDGSSWMDAYTALQSALDAALPGDQVWVANGVYTPTQRTDAGDARTATFVLTDGVALYGGFAGGETALDQRDWEANVTVLSGDVDGNDVTDVYGVVTDTGNITGSNVYHVVVADGVTATAVLDGFWISGGYADGDTFGTDCGGGVRADGGSPTLKDLAFSGNYGWFGGGLFNWYGSPALTGIVFVGNVAVHGGGMCGWGGSSTVTDAAFRDNVAGTGGALDSNEADLTVRDVVFEGNSARGNGGGIIARESVLTLTNVTFVGNVSGDDGGGMHNEDGALSLTNGVFSGNTAVSEGGGLATWSARTVLANVTFAGNDAGNCGGAVGSAYMWEPDGLELANCILWGNTASIMSSYGQVCGPATLRYSLMEGGCPAGITCDHLLDADPLFVREPDPGPDGTWGTTDDDYGDLRLRPGSPAIDAGNNLSVPVSVTTDLAGSPRFLDVPWWADTGVGTPPIVDMGAYEATYTTRYVDQDATGLGNGLSWTDAYTALQSALDAALPGDQVWVANGVYTPTQRTDAGDARTATFVLTDGVALYGGFAGGETALDQRDWEANVTVLSGDVDGNDVTDVYGVVTNTGNISGSNVYHVVVADGVTATAVLDGFWISGGNADGDTFDTGTGGGVRADGGSPTLQHLTFSGNYGDLGGGLCTWHGSPVLTGIVFVGNTAIGGGGMCSWGGSPTVTDAAFRGNVSSTGGGAVESNGADLTMRDVVFEGNSARGDGGGAHAYMSVLTLIDVVFYGNESEDGGGGIYSESSSLSLTNGLFVGNKAIGGGAVYVEVSSHSPTVLTNATLVANEAGGIFYLAGGAVHLANSVLWGNTAGAGWPDTWVQVWGPSALSYSLVEDGCPAGGDCDHVYDADPLFVRQPEPGTDGIWGTPDDDYGDLRLRPGSPAVDAGNNLSVPVSVTTDLAGSPRFLDVAGQPDTGLGTPPIVDMGAYEAAFVDLTVSKAVMPTVVAPGDAITYTLSFSNAGSLLARGVVLTDGMPLTVTVTHVVSSGVQITDTGAASAAERVWAVADLAPGEGGAITITGVVSPSVGGVFSLTNWVVITTTGEDWDAGNNVAHVSSTVDGDAPQIVGTLPDSGAKDVALTALLVITFDESIQAGTLVYTVAPDPGGWSEAWSGDGTVVTLTHSVFAAMEMYTVTVAAAEDGMGNPLLGSPYVWTFETVAYRVHLPLVAKEE